MFWAIVHFIQSYYNSNPIAQPPFLHIFGEFKYIMCFLMLKSMLWSLIVLGKRNKFVFAKKKKDFMIQRMWSWVTRNVGGESIGF